MNWTKARAIAILCFFLGCMALISFSMFVSALNASTPQTEEYSWLK